MRGTERRRLALAACLVVLVAGLLARCGGESESTTEKTAPPAGTTTAPAAPATSSEAAPTTTSAAEPALATRTFQMPSRNIGCAFTAGFLRCDILSGLSPEPSQQCELDWVGLVLGSTGAAEPECAGDTAYDQQAPVLAYGRTWARGGVTCQSRRDGLRCTGEDGHGFSLARAGWEAS